MNQSERRELDDSLAWLYARTRGQGKRDPGRMQMLLEALDLAMPPRVVHVVGTNGKGTVTNLVASAAVAAGLRTGRFVSPHVEEFGERVAVDGKLMSGREIIAFVERVRSLSLPVSPAFFELCLALALERFAAARVDLAVMEAGVGARADATAVLHNVAAVAVTPIALDHLETLGPTLADIAHDKAAALRPGVPAASAPQQPRAARVLRLAASEVGAELHTDDDEDSLFRLDPGLEADGASDPTLYRNRRLAAATVRLLGGIPESSLAAGLRAAPLPGRGERFEVDGVSVLLDGAHDPAAAEALTARLEGGYVLLFGSLARKRGEDTLRALERGARRVFVTRATDQPITVEPAERREVVEEPRQALGRALSACRPADLLLIAGSLYLAGELRPLLRDLSPVPPRVG